MEWADSARRGPDVLTLRRTLVTTLPRIEAEAAESRPSVTERGSQAAEWHRYLHAEGALVPDEGEECGPWHHRLFLAAASPAGPGAVPHSERAGEAEGGVRQLREALLDALIDAEQDDMIGPLYTPDSLADYLTEHAKVRAALASRAHPDEPRHNDADGEMCAPGCPVWDAADAEWDRTHPAPFPHPDEE